LTDSLRRERDRAERASQAKTRFFSAASHDLRQPLTALSYNAATVRALAEVSGDETLAKVGQGISRALDESRALLDSLLEVSELDAGAVRVNWEAVDIGSLLREVVDTCASVARERGLDLRLQCDEAESLAAWADVALLRRVVHNLVGNALKFTQSGHVLLHFRGHWEGAEQSIEICVTDTGPGIPHSAQEHVFEEFFQVGNAERDRSRGLGLGLAIVRRLVALQQGSITLHSVPGEGATFRVLLRRSTPVSASLVVNSAGEGAAHALFAGGRYVMVVDDEREIRDSVTTLLTTFGWVVCAASDLASAVAAWKGGFVPDALVVDFRLREGGSGLDVLRELRECGCAAPALMITGDTEPGRIAAARAAGIPVMYKPVDGFMLAKSLAKLVENGGDGA
jgi:CheY-like chemotaxis protein